LGQPLCRGTLGNSFVKQLQGTASGSRIGKLSGIILRNNYFEEQQLLGVIVQITSGSSSQQQLWGAAFGSYFGV